MVGKKKTDCGRTKAAERETTPMKGRAERARAMRSNVERNRHQTATEEKRNRLFTHVALPGDRKLSLNSQERQIPFIIRSSAVIAAALVKYTNRA